MKKIIFPILLLACMFAAACNDWTENEAVDLKTTRPSDENPDLVARYRKALRDYKAREHFLVIAHFDNAPAVATGERDFMRGLPDSLDMVLLTNADNFSKYDAEDMPIMGEKGTKVIYRIDYAARMDEFADAASLGAYLDQVVASVNEHGMDGYSFTGIPREGDPARAEAAALLVSKLAAEDNKVVIFEGDPTFVAAADRAKIDYFVLNTEATDNVTDVKMQVARARSYAGIPAANLLLAADVAAPILNEEKEEQNAVEELTARVISIGPLGGIAIHNPQRNYYSAERNYPLLCEAIQKLNPSK